MSNQDTVDAAIARFTATPAPTLPPRPSARQMVRDDAAKYGWELLAQPTLDVFSKGTDRVVIGWRAVNATDTDFNQVSTGSMRYVSTGIECVERGRRQLCIIDARDWLRTLGN